MGTVLAKIQEGSREVTSSDLASSQDQAFVLARSGDSIQSVGEVMDRAGAHVAIITDAGRVVGVVSDGDLRRAFLKSLAIDEPIDVVMTRDFQFVEAGRMPEEVQLLVNRYKVLPVLSSESSLVGTISSSQSTVFQVAAPDISAEDIAAVENTMQAGWISSKSFEVRAFEEEFADSLALHKGLAVANGTVALELALMALGLEAGDEVLVPAFAFAAVANAVIAVGCVPVFVDIEAQNLGIAVVGLEKFLSHRVKALIVVHTYGAPAEIELIAEFASKNNLLLIEDCAEAIGTKVKNMHVGNFGDACTFSFFANKTISTGEGGFVAFASGEALDKAAQIRDHGMSRQKKYWHDTPGRNFRMTGIQASLGRSQLTRLSKLVEARVENFEIYSARLSSRPELEFRDGSVGRVHSHWLSDFRLSSSYVHYRDDLIERLGALGVEARPYFYPMNKMPAFEHYSPPSLSLPVSEYESLRGICLPSSSSLRRQDIEEVCGRVEVALDGLA